MAPIAVARGNRTLLIPRTMIPKPRGIFDDLRRNDGGELDFEGCDDLKCDYNAALARFVEKLQPIRQHITS